MTEYRWAVIADYEGPGPNSVTVEPGTEPWATPPEELGLRAADCGFRGLPRGDLRPDPCVSPRS
jgi:hypothetical protein